ncbi:hypothetical protein NL676_010473 [Syzygium grande]|nr:hypothetical protein NL676_010473 [Syzygium grande]
MDMDPAAGEPSGPVPVLTTREKGLVESKEVPRWRASSRGSSATTPEWKGRPRMLRATMARGGLHPPLGFWGRRMENGGGILG